MSERDIRQEVHTQDVLRLSKKARERAERILARSESLQVVATRYKRQRDEYRANAQQTQQSLDSLLAAHPIASAPEECKPYTDAITLCQQQVNELKLADSLSQEQARTQTERADSLALTNVSLIATNSKLESTTAIQSERIRALAHPKLLGLIPLPSRTVTFIVGAGLGFLLGIQ